MLFNRKNSLILSIIVVVLVVCASQVHSQGGHPIRLLGLWSKPGSTSGASLSWLYPTIPAVTVQGIMSLPSSASLPSAVGQIMTARNSTSVFLPVATSATSQQGTDIWTCNTASLRCSIDFTLLNLQTIAMSYDQKTQLLWLVARNMTLPSNTPQFSVIVAHPSSASWSQVHAIVSSVPVVSFEAALGPVQYYLYWTTSSTTAFGTSINIATNATSPTVSFATSSMIPRAIIYNSNSLTNLTSLCLLPNNPLQNQTIQVCSPDFTKGTVQLPRNGTPWFGASPSPFAALEHPHFYYYSIAAPSNSQQYYMWITNAMDGWTISNSTLPTDRSLWAVTTLSTAV